ncbi:MAG: hypothetical protein ACYTFG_12295 [Planctomycetota bacterium]|jgi:hypothetical protein
MKYLPVILLVIGGCVSAPKGKPGPWRELKAVGGLVAVEFPGEPERDAGEADGPDGTVPVRYENHVLEVGESVFALQIMCFGDKLEEKKFQFGQTRIKGDRRGARADEVYSRPANMGDIRGQERKLRMQHGQVRRVALLRQYVFDRYLVSMMWGGLASGEEEADVERFFESLRLRRP